MENEKLLKRLQELELEVQKLKSQVAPAAGHTARVVKKSITFVLSYWTLLSFLVAIGVAIFIKWKFDVDYFENYRTIAESRKLSAFHQKLGEKLLLRQEWTAAEDAFTKALDADKNNTDASYGLVKSRIFKPLPEEKFSPVETQDTTIAFLREQRPNDPDLDLFQGVRHWNLDQVAEAKKSFLAALEKNPNFGAAQMMLAHISVTEEKLDDAVEWCRKGLANLPEDPNAMSNMAWYLMLKGGSAEAIPLLEKSVKLSGMVLPSLVLADALRMQGKFEESKNYSRHAVKILTDGKFNETRMVGSQWFFNWLPTAADDHESWKNGIYANGLPRKQALGYFSLALDCAFAGEWEEARSAFSKMREAEPGSQLDDFYKNKIASVIFHAKLDVSDPRIEKLMRLLLAPPVQKTEAAQEQ